ncbi:MAG: aspartate-semialdehyde dehydrogenase [Clostridia bacterium]|nr:aspartate-semialdehyde dehydrogenase [Clostridia bacterium]
MKKYRLALVGATGVVGRVTRNVLEKYNLPISEYKFFSSSRSAGTKIVFNNEEYTVEELNEHSFDNGFDYAIFTAGGKVSEKYAPIAVQNKCTVIDNSSFYRMDKEVPLVVPEVNMEDAERNNGIIANPNCSTIQAVVALSPLDRKYRIKRIVYSTYQAVSGAGLGGIQDLESAIENYVANTKYELKKFPYDIFNNCIPHIDDFTDDRYTKEEHKMIDETRKILKRSNLPITATTVRVPVFNSHSESINVEFEKEFEINDLIETLKEAPGVIVKDDISNNIYPMPKDANNQDKVLVGRIRRDYSVKSGVNLWVVADNTRKGAGGNAVQILNGLIKYINKN